MKQNLVLLLLGIVASILIGCSDSREKLCVEGFAAYDAGEYEDAYFLLERAYTDERSDPELVVRLADCRVSVAGDINGAIFILRDSALRYPDYAPTFYQLGIIAYNYSTKDNDENIRQAITFTRHAAALNPKDFQTVDTLGMLYLMIGELDSAMNWFEVAKEIKPDHLRLNERIHLTRQLIEQRALSDTLNLE